MTLICPSWIPEAFDIQYLNGLLFKWLFHVLYRSFEYRKSTTRWQPLGWFSNGRAVRFLDSTKKLGHFNNWHVRYSNPYCSVLALVKKKCWTSFAVCRKIASHFNLFSVKLFIHQCQQVRRHYYAHNSRFILGWLR